MSKCQQYRVSRLQVHPSEKGEYPYRIFREMGRRRLSHQKVAKEIGVSFQVIRAYLYNPDYRPSAPTHAALEEYAMQLPPTYESGSGA